MNTLYPLKFYPILKERVWGGDSLSKKYNKTSDPNIKVGESWELSGVQDDISVVSNGFLEGNNIEEVIEVYMGDLVGDTVFEKYGKEFPLLIKLIDASDDLSIQVHPDDSLAIERHNAYGKTEMWYILESGPKGKIWSGFKKESGKEQFMEAVENKTIEKLLNSEKARAGDTYYIPPGRIHSLGGGIVLAEIQQTSDVTYRIYDWERSGLDGKPRDLHLDLAADALDFSAVKDYVTRVRPELNDSITLVECDHFTVNLLKLDNEAERDYTRLDSFVTYLCLEGTIDIDYGTDSINIRKGETVLIPATAESITLKSNQASLLEVFIETN